ncbi:VOC family protein [Rubellimicrobium roseum]|uniref:Glyoxalase/bleomycin resistance/extradiol dioxygenase family protein n=1 Tax=Rubellimicrobium roseum TaxID=687525 RepID=A0A5C4NMW6_9RHOB|nr:VOC family protein [Rubellimicrobium roseum]TNC73729.1 glyoxalase/bleomycin resistance/extradiol dioxygenase family protein [Rubellimicrobium roseum]
MPQDPPALILETAIYAEDLDAAEAFYGDVLGLARISRVGRRHVFYRCGPGVLLIFNPAETEVVDPASPLPVPPHGARGPGHLCFAAEPLGLAAWRARLEAAGIAIEAETDWPSGGRSFYFRDPAGNSLEVAEARIWGG